MPYTPSELSRAINAQLDCALWSSITLDPATGDTIHLDCCEPHSDLGDTIAKDLLAFLSEPTVAADITDLGISPEQAGHDFWLTRNRHGAGFWDRGHGLAGERLTAAAHLYGECELYLGDDNLVYAN
jgi:hypothetical protein